MRLSTGTKAAGRAATAGGARIAVPLLVALLLGAVPAAGCSSSSDGAEANAPVVVADGCQPLLADPATPSTTGACLAPYPSDFHRVSDPRSATRFRLGLRGAARPKTVRGQESDLHDVFAADGASLIPTIVAALAGDVVRDGLPGVLHDATRSARPDSPTVILEADSGALVPHYGGPRRSPRGSAHADGAPHLRAAPAAHAVRGGDRRRTARSGGRQVGHVERRPRER